MTLADDLQATARSLAAGWPIKNLNRLRRVRTMSTTTTTSAILNRLTAAHGVVDRIGFDFDADSGYTEADVLREIAGARRTSAEMVAMLAGLASLLSDAGEEISRLSAECAGLRARLK